MSQSHHVNTLQQMIVIQKTKWQSEKIAPCEQTLIDVALEWKIVYPSFHIYWIEITKQKLDSAERYVAEVMDHLDQTRSV